MRRLLTLLALAAVGSLALAGVVALPATGAAKFVASFSLDGPPSWQSSAQRADMGSWVKHSSPVVADLGDGPVILVGSLGGKLYALRYSNGSLKKLWDTGSAINTFIDSSPAVGDLNRDGCPEIVVGAGNEFRSHNAGVHVFDCHGRNHRFWPAPTGPRPNHVGVFATPAIGDVDGDGYPEVVYGSFNEKIYVKDRNGRDLPGWPQENLDTIWSSPALADINRDGKREVIIGTDLGGGAAAHGCAKGIRGMVRVMDAKGGTMPNYPKCLDTPIWSSPAVQDINGDGSLDAIVGTNNYFEYGSVVGDPRKVRAWDTKSGRLLWETALGNGTRVFSSPAVGDVGGDGSLDVAFGTLPASNHGEVFLLEARTGRVRWHHQGGKHEVCECKFMGSPVIADVDGDGKAEVIALSQDGGMNAWDEAGKTVIDDLHAPARSGDPVWKTTSHMFFNSPAVADLDGDGDNEIVLASALAGSDPKVGRVWVVQTSGRGEAPWPFFKRTTDRISTLGKGTSGNAPPAPAPAPPAPAPVRTSRPSAPASTASPTPTPTPEPVESPSQSPLAFVLPRSDNPSSGLKVVLGLLGAGGAISAAGLSFVSWRRRGIG